MPKAKVIVKDRTPIRAAIANRIKHPFGMSESALPLKDPRRWQQRIFDRGFRNNRISEAKYKGWVPLEPEDIEGDPEDYGWRVDGHQIVRGDRGSEIVMKMQKDEWKLVNQAKTAANVKQTFGIKQTKAAILERSSQEQGDQATSFLAKAMQTMQVQDKLETPLEDD